MKEKMIAFTLDIDWATEATIDYALSIFETYGVKCTIFATHKSAILRNCNPELFEIGLHPNFNTIFQNQKVDFSQTILELKKNYPQAKGIRSHSLTSSTFLLNIFKEFDMKYEANHLLPYYSEIKPIKLWNNLISIPFNWEDDVHFMYRNSFKNSKLDIDSKKLNILNFHPIHILMNTPNEEYYTSIKQHYKNDKELILLKNKKITGVQDLLENTLKQVNEKEINNFTLIEISQWI